jgi:hypothetical protein
LSREAGEIFCAVRYSARFVTPIWTFFNTTRMLRPPRAVAADAIQSDEVLDMASSLRRAHCEAHKRTKIEADTKTIEQVVLHVEMFTST